MKSVVVCGSKRYKKEIAAFCKELESLGVLVFEPSFDEVVPEEMTFDSAYITGKVFKGLTLEHFDWIRKSEVCYVYNPSGYVGTSVTMEMAYASALSKPIFALERDTGEPCRNALIDRVISTPKSLAQLL
jgi:hypothetical protein